ncbi:MAG: FkbM family methyltransferase [Bacteroidota bacterium]
MIKPTIENILSRWAGKERHQRFFEWLQEQALKGMHIGQGGGMEATGQAIVLDRLKAKNPDKKKWIVFDVGANKGDYSQLVVDRFGKQAKIFAFEPSASTFALLRKRFGASEQISLVQLGMSDQESTQTLYSNKPGSGLASLYDRKLVHHNIQLEAVEMVELTTLDVFCSKNNISEIDLLKLDIEGHELAALQGAQQLLQTGKIHRIQFEFGGCNIDSRTFFQDFYYLLNPQYRIYRIVKDGWFEVTDYRENYEAFKTTNFMAVLRS